MQRIYADYNATTPLKIEVREKMISAMETHWANPSSTHQLGREVRSLIEEARDQVALAIKAQNREVLFTSGGTEANNLALLGVAELQEVGHIITSPMEHSSVKQTIEELSQRGWEVTWLTPSKSGSLNTQQILDALQPNTKLVSIQWVNNETGIIYPVGEIANALPENIWFHCDAVQALGRINIDVSNNAFDSLSLSAHKIGGPKGCGALYVKHAEPLMPRQFGGSQEREVRPGTENLYGIIGFGEAASVIDVQAWNSKTKELRDHLETSLIQQIKSCIIHGHDLNRTSNTSSILLSGCKADMLLMGLDIQGIYASAGSACSSGSVRYSKVIQSMGYTIDEAAATLRISWGVESQLDEVDTLVEKLTILVSMQT